MNKKIKIFRRVSNSTSNLNPCWNIEVIISLLDLQMKCVECCRIMCEICFHLNLLWVRSIKQDLFHNNTPKWKMRNTFLPLRLVSPHVQDLCTQTLLSGISSATIEQKKAQICAKVVMARIYMNVWWTYSKSQKSTRCRHKNVHVRRSRWRKAHLSS